MYQQNRKRNKAKKSCTYRVEVDPIEKLRKDQEAFAKMMMEKEKQSKVK